MWSWLIIALLYVLGIGFFRWLGGVAAASDAIAAWGRATAEKRRHKLSKRGVKEPPQRA
jgi:hypothetical protein